MSRLRVLYESDVPHRAVSVYLYLAERANKKGECWPAIPTIAEDLKLSESTVRRAVKDLKKAGLLSTQQRFRETEGKAVCVIHCDRKKEGCHEMEIGKQQT